MRIESVSITEEYDKVLETIVEQEKQEFIASGTLATETLNKLNISIENLPQKCQQLLQNITKLSPGIQKIDSTAISLNLTEKISQELEGNYEILNLKQKNREMQMRIDKNKKEIDDLRRELKDAKTALAGKKINPGNIQDHIRQLSLKLASYEESYEKSKARFKRYSVPEVLYPKSLEVLVNQLANLKSEEAMLKEKVDEHLFTRNIRDTFIRLRK